MNYLQEDCEIYLKPSTELIPDEYPQDDNEKSCVHIFIFKENAEREFVECMRSLGYLVPEKNIHPLSSRKEVLHSLQKISEEIQDKTSLIILFWGLFRADKKFLLKDGSAINLIEIWSQFVSTICPELRDKPKIFIFNGVKHLENTEEDALPATRRSSESFKYNIPAEADILIVFKQNYDLNASLEYMESLCSNFENYAQREDISSLLTIAHFASQPTLISTMTRKFYLKPCPNRGIQLTIREKYSKINQAIQKVKENIIILTKDKKKTPERNVELTEIRESVSSLKKASSIEENLHRRVMKNDGVIKFRQRSNTLPRLLDVDKTLHKRRVDQRPAWRY